MKSNTIAIVGGGVLGSATAYFLASNEAFNGRVVVFEPDPTYARSSTARSAAAIRQQFNVPVNIQLSQFSYDFFANAHAILRVDGQVPALDFTDCGYLILAPTDGVDRLTHAHRLQRSHGVKVEFLMPDQLVRRFPWLDVRDVGAASLGLHGEGWLDPLALLRALRHKAEALGVRYVPAEVSGIQVEGNRVVAVELVDGSHVDVGTVINAAGAQAGRVARMAGIELPVEPRKRSAFVFHAEAPPSDFPNFVDPTFANRGVYVRPFGEHFLAVTSPDPDKDPATSDFEVDLSLFERVVRPALARRVKGFQHLKLVESWAGHYEFNTFDQNAILGPHPENENYIFACGFSGHGVMHAPAAGRGIAELVVGGSYETIDLSPLSYHRIMARQPLDDPRRASNEGDRGSQLGLSQA